MLGIDDWSWRKGESYETVMVDVRFSTSLPGRSAVETADWLCQHPNVEVVSRIAADFNAQGNDKAPEMRQVADRFHLLQNLRERIDYQVGEKAG